MKIELADHVGVAPGGAVVDHGQWVVMCDGTHVGYLQKTEGSWLQCIVFMDDSTKTELVDAITRQAQMKIGGVVLPVDPDLLPEAEDEGEDDE